MARIWVAGIALLFCASSAASQPNHAASLHNVAEAVRAAPLTQVPKVSSVAEAAAAAPSPALAQAVQKGQLYTAALTPAQEAAVTAGLKERLGLSARPGFVIPLPQVLTQQAADGSQVQLKALALVDQGLTQQPNGEFAGSIRVGVVELDQSGQSKALSAPILFQVIGPVQADPSPVTVGETSPPFAQVKLTTRSAAGGLTVKVASSFDPNGVDVAVPMASTLRLIASTSEIDGFGLEAADVNVSALGLASPKGTPVDLELTGRSGYLEASNVRLDDAGQATTHVRSSGLGPITITATAPGFSPVTQTIQSRWPLMTLGAAALGGLLGGVIKLLAGARRRRWIGHVLLSVLMGLLVFLLYAVGVNVLPVHPTVTVGAALVAAIAALGGYYGASLLPGPKPA